MKFGCLRLVSRSQPRPVWESGSARLVYGQPWRHGHAQMAYRRDEGLRDVGPSRSLRCAQRHEANQHRELQHLHLVSVESEVTNAAQRHNHVIYLHMYMWEGSAPPPQYAARLSRSVCTSSSGPELNNAELILMALKLGMQYTHIASWFPTAART